MTQDEKQDANSARAARSGPCMTKVKFLILGAGPSGLTFAHTLQEAGEHSFLVIEKELEPGGLCRSAIVDGAPLDIGGGHFLDVRKKEVLEFLFRFMPESEWNKFSRIAKLRLRGSEVDHPLESNLWQLPDEVQADFLESIAQAGSVRGEPMPESFEEWICWKLGERIAREYMLPYNRKMWRMPLEKLGTYWLYKLPDVSFRETLLSCLKRRAEGSLPAHGTFLYPKKFGYGEVWRRMGEELGDHLVPGQPVSKIDVSQKTVNGNLRAEVIVNTIPWPAWQRTDAVPDEVGRSISQLVHTSVDVDYEPENPKGAAHWIYEPDENIRYHRILCRANFCPGSKGCWTETNAAASGPAKSFRHRNEFAYPVNTAEKPKAVEAINKWARANGILPLGRWGEWEHMNSDVAVSLAMKATKDQSR